MQEKFSFTTGTVVRILVAEGDTIYEGQHVLDVQVAYGIVPMTAWHSGSVMAVCVSEGDSLGFGDVVLELGKQESGIVGHVNESQNGMDAFPPDLPCSDEKGTSTEVGDSEKLSEPESGGMPASGVSEVDNTGTESDEFEPSADSSLDVTPEWPDWVDGMRALPIFSPMREMRFDVDASVAPWVPVGVVWLIVTVLSIFALHWFFLIPCLILLSYLIWRQILLMQLLQRRFWLDTYLKPTSSIRKWLRGKKVLQCIALVAAVPLAVITYIALYTYSWLDCLFLGGAIACAVALQRLFVRPVDSHIAGHLSELVYQRIFTTIAVLLVLFGLALASVTKGLSEDHADLSSDEMATRVIDEYKHPVLFVRHCARTVRYCELWLLKVRDINGWPYGWGIYFFFLCPNAIPAYGVVTAFRTIETICGERIL